MTPYYSQDGITIYHADCREMLPHLDPVDLVLTDPPYGIGEARNKRGGLKHGAAIAVSKNYGSATWDDFPPDAITLRAIVALGRYAILWGGNYFGLPASRCWLVWDKETGTNGYADAELAWTNLPGAVRLKRHRWMGMLQEYGGQGKEMRWHPTQKPVPVMCWAIGLTPEADTILDPYMGSGTVLRAAKDLGRRAIGIEIEERYCEIAANRLAQKVFEFSGNA